ncbi:uncharacterized protein LOC124925274 [Impatiens glandulifera]|uniref:uncharacterized protein LOC124925274 n=1 Tax=Impatiens glandulifera TaxID=253017 RepID=UPI001FB13CE0|nr:uncharacterized protein LOC124925274 [Impatiens glandulifera]
MEKTNRHGRSSQAGNILLCCRLKKLPNWRRRGEVVAVSVPESHRIAGLAFNVCFWLLIIALYLHMAETTVPDFPGRISWKSALCLKKIVMKFEEMDLVEKVYNTQFRYIVSAPVLQFSGTIEDYDDEEEGSEPEDEHEEPTSKPNTRKRKAALNLKEAVNLKRKLAYESSPAHIPSPPSATSPGLPSTSSVGCKCEELKEEVKALKEELIKEVKEELKEMKTAYEETQTNHKAYMKKLVVSMCEQLLAKSNQRMATLIVKLDSMEEERKKKKKSKLEKKGKTEVDGGEIENDVKVGVGEIQTDVKNWLKDEATNDETKTMFTCEARKKLFVRVLTKSTWLKDPEIDAVCHLLRKRIEQYPKTYKHCKVSIGDCLLADMMRREYPNYKKDPEKFPIADVFSQYFWGAPHRHMPEWPVVDDIYVPLNIGNKHWVLCVVRVQDNHIDVYDCDSSIYRNLDPYMRPLCEMFPRIYAMGASDAELKRYPNFNFQKLTYKRLPHPAKNAVAKYGEVPRAEESGDCGVFMLMHMEYLTVGLGVEKNLTCAYVF